MLLGGLTEKFSSSHGSDQKNTTGMQDRGLESRTIRGFSPFISFYTVEC